MITMLRQRVGSCLLWGGVFLLFLVCLPNQADGNGGYKSQYGYPAAPAIPVQRAMIIHRDGVQTLIVESAFDSPSPEVGWILPLPAEPVDLDAADPSLLTALSVAMQPRVQMDEGRWLPVAKWLFLITLFIAVLAVAFPRRLRLVEVAVVLLVVAVAAAVLLPSLNSARRSLGAEITGVIVSSRHQVGDYEAAVLRADDAAALSQWLSAHELAPLDATEQAIVDDYIAREWCFVVAHLRRDAGGEAVPHPLIATFPAEQPVFPMKLTAIGGSKTLVELFIVADEQAAVAGFHCVAADTFRHKVQTERRGMIHASSYESDQTRLTIGNADAGAWMWDGCVVTKLTAELTPKQMNRDVEITFRELSPHRDHLYSARARRGMTLKALLLGGTVVFASLGLVMNGRRQPTRPELVTVLVLLGLTFTAGGVVHGVVPVTQLREVSRGQHIMSYRLLSEQQRLIESLIEEGLLNDRASEAAMRVFMERWEEWPGLSENPLTGEAFQVQRTPGNFALREVDGAVYFCLYDADGRELLRRLPGAGVDAE